MLALRLSDMGDPGDGNAEDAWYACKGCQAWVDRQTEGFFNTEPTSNLYSPNASTSSLIQRFKETTASRCNDSGTSVVELKSQAADDCNGDDSFDDLGTTLMNDYTLTEDSREYVIAFNKGPIGIQFETELWSYNILVRRIEEGTQAADLRNVIKKGDCLVGVNGRSLLGVGFKEAMILVRRVKELYQQDKLDTALRLHFIPKKP
jgi:hypothetical protein